MANGVQLKSFVHHDGMRTFISVIDADEPHAFDGPAAERESPPKKQ